MNDDQRTNVSVTLASYEQGIEEYLQGTSPALLLRRVRTRRRRTPAVGLADAGARERTRTRCSLRSRGAPQDRAVNPPEPSRPI